jgi:hypothetical protein
LFQQLNNPYDSYGFVSTTFAEDEARRRRKGGPGNWTWVVREVGRDFRILIKN